MKEESRQKTKLQEMTTQRQKARSARPSRLCKPEGEASGSNAAHLQNPCGIGAALDGKGAGVTGPFVITCAGGN